MTVHDDRSLAHPIELARDMAEVVRILDRLADEMQFERERQTRNEALQRGQTVNDVLWSGAALLDAQGTWRKSFQVPYASITVDDVSSIGPLFILNDQSDTNQSAQGIGRWQVGVGQMKTIPLLGTSLSITTGGPNAFSVVCVAVHSKPQPPSAS